MAPLVGMDGAESVKVLLDRTLQKVPNSLAETPGDSMCLEEADESHLLWMSSANAGHQRIQQWQQRHTAEALEVTSHQGSSLLCCQRKWFTPRSITSLVCEVLCVDGSRVSQRSPRPLPANIRWQEGGKKNINKTKQNISLRWWPSHKSFLSLALFQAGRHFHFRPPGRTFQFHCVGLRLCTAWHY